MKYIFYRNIKTENVFIRIGGTDKFEDLTTKETLTEGQILDDEDFVRVDAFQHVRNPSCVYQRTGDTNIFQWSKSIRHESNIYLEIIYNQKFKPL